MTTLEIAPADAPDEDEAWWPGCGRPHPLQLKPWLDELYILTKNLTLARLGDVMTLPQLEFVAQCQRQLDETGQIRQVVLKARQMGFSTIIEGIGFILAIRIANLNGRILSHRGDSAESILTMMQRYWRTYPFRRYHVEQYGGKKQLSWADTGSNIQVMTAGSKESGRSNTIQFLHACLAAGTRIPTTDGMCNVEDLLGKTVRTHTGAHARVSAVSRRDDRPLVEITTWRGRPMLVTPEHKFPLADGSQRPAAELRPGDLLVHPVRPITDTHVGFDLPCTPQRVGKGVGNGRQRVSDGKRFRLDEETGFALGYFLAEGSFFFNKGDRPAGIMFSRHRDERAYADRACAALDGLFSSRRTDDRPDSLTSTDVLYGSGLAELFLSLVGRHAWDKTVPEWAWEAGIPFCRGLLAGYLSGDGSKAELLTQGYVTHRMSARTTSENMAYAMRELALSLGYGWGCVRSNGVRERYGKQARPSWDIDWHGSSARALRTLVGLPVTNEIGRPRTEKVRVVDNRALIPVREVFETGQRGTVYDIEVDHPDHTFVAADYATSNSEVAFWIGAETLMTGLRQAIPQFGLTAMFLESTANGIGNYFHQQYTLAKKGRSEYQAMFFPWWRHPEYRAAYLPRAEQAKHTLTTLDKEEKSLVTRFGLTADRLLWRRWAIENLCSGSVDTFHQEYPSDDKEAFVSTGRNVFPLPLIVAHADLETGRVGRLTRDRRGRVTFHEDPDGPLTVFRPPSTDRDWGVYLIGADPTHTTAGDNACAQVINRRTLEQVAVYRRKTDPITFAKDIELLGHFYHEALIAPEKEGPGYATVGALVASNYVNVYRHQNIVKAQGTPQDTFGWSTNTQSKHLAISHLLRAIKDPLATIQSVTYGLVIHDEQTAAEMRDYVTKEDGSGYTNSDGSPYDDGVMALAIALTVHNIEPPVPAYQPRKPHELPANVANRPVDSPMTSGAAQPLTRPAPPEPPADDTTDPDVDLPADDTAPWERWGRKDDQ